MIRFAVVLLACVSAACSTESKPPDPVPATWLEFAYREREALLIFALIVVLALVEGMGRRSR